MFRRFLFPFLLISFVVQAEKTFNEPDAPASHLRRHLEASAAGKEPVGIRFDDAVHSTSTKQGVAALLRLVGAGFDFDFGKLRQT